MIKKFSNPAELTKEIINLGAEISLGCDYWPDMEDYQKLAKAIIDCVKDNKFTQIVKYQVEPDWSIMDSMEKRGGFDDEDEFKDFLQDTIDYKFDDHWLEGQGQVLYMYGAPGTQDKITFYPKNGAIQLDLADTGGITWNVFLK
jgi:hypothetical protein